MSPLWRHLRRVGMLAAAICLMPVGLLYADAMGKISLGESGIASVEYVRSNGMFPRLSTGATRWTPRTSFVAE
jgi:hypothetical protein